MNRLEPVALLFADMEKLGPGDNADTLHVLRLLPRQQFSLVVDAGCGRGRQTLALAQELFTQVHAVDSSESFLNDLRRRAAKTNIEHLVRTHCMDMKDIPSAFRDIDLLWAEGAAYNIGFSNALATWLPALIPKGFAVVSELSWLRNRAPAVVKEYFLSAYPDMRTVQDNIRTGKKAGYELITTYTLPRHTWIDGYYDILKPRANALLNHSDRAVREFAEETVREIEIFELSEDSYGYVFYVFQRG